MSLRVLIVRLGVVTCAGALAVLLPTTAHAEIFGFACITNNSPTDCDILTSQVALNVTGGISTVNFRFENSGPDSSSITDVYFSDLMPALLGNPAYITTSGSSVQFATGCAPGNLAGGNPYGFSTSYCADSDSPVQPLGVNPGEWLNIGYTLQDGATFDDVIAAIMSGDYRVGVHVQGFAGGGSESGIVNQVPEPVSILLIGLGALTGVGVRRWRWLRA